MVGLVFFIFVAVILVCYYLFAEDSRESRSVLPWAFLITAIASLLIGLWIIYYIFFMYPKNDVWITGLDDEGSHKNKKERKDADDGDTPAAPKKNSDIDDDYSKESKPLYVLNHALSPFLYAIAFILFFFTTKDWVDRHANQDRAHG